jgi:Holliday junction resolvasome RuvABC endonuclease subunit
MNILALDVATKTGYCTQYASGVWDFTTKRDESKGMKLIRFTAKLTCVCRLENINLIVFERSAGRHKASIIVQSELHGALKLFCEQNGIEYRAYSAKEIKVAGAGKGNASKQMMIDAAKEKHGMKGDSDNEADAIHLYHLAKKDYL